jgi:hypothetical protein
MINGINDLAEILRHQFKFKIFNEIFFVYKFFKKQ